MGRVLGRVEYADGESDRFLIHDDTTGWSIPALYADPDEAWRIYYQGDVEGLLAAMPQRDTVVRSIRKVLARSSSFPANGEIYGEPMFGLATKDRLLTPLSSDDFDDTSYSLLEVDGEIHVAEEVDGGIGGRYDKPLCAERWNWRGTDRRLRFEDVFGRPLNLCSSCVETLLRAERDE
jgi:hypothetical protein